MLPKSADTPAQLGAEVAIAASSADDYAASPSPCRRAQPPSMGGAGLTPIALHEARHTYALAEDRRRRERQIAVGARDSRTLLDPELVEEDAPPGVELVVPYPGGDDVCLGAVGEGEPGCLVGEVAVDLRP